MPKTLLIYALGGGWGHLNRILALARVAATKYRIKLISNSPYLSRIDTENCQVFAISPQASFQQTGDRLKQIIQQEAFDGVIVDTFPRGLGGELADLLPNIRQPKVLVNRYLNLEYIQRYRLKEFVRRNYNLIIIPGENTPSAFADLPQTIKTNPWLIRGSQKLANLPTAADLLGLTIKQTQQPLIIILASGYEAELALYGEIAHSLHQQGYQVRCLSGTLPPTCPLEIWRCHYPALECLWLADLVIGSGGYNTVFECDRLNLPLVAIPHKRLYDCQETRITAQQSKCWLAKDKSTAVKLTQQLLSPIKTKPLKPTQFNNGAEEALEILAAIFS
ncbi:MAG: UDP-N-acetylglucosamine--LPS N-acetylglucosamine transferase [Pleurocapsa sp.]